MEAPTQVQTLQNVESFSSFVHSHMQEPNIALHYKERGQRLLATEFPADFRHYLYGIAENLVKTRALVITYTFRFAERVRKYIIHGLWN